MVYSLYQEGKILLKMAVMAFVLFYLTLKMFYKWSGKHILAEEANKLYKNRQGTRYLSP
jgi:hypothetical protein